MPNATAHNGILPPDGSQLPRQARHSTLRTQHASAHRPAADPALNQTRGRLSHPLRPASVSTDLRPP
jgi:hypothetical protein